MTCRSLWQTPLAAKRTSTSCGPGSSTSTSSTTRGLFTSYKIAALALIAAPPHFLEVAIQGRASPTPAPRLCRIFGFHARRNDARRLVNCRGDRIEFVPTLTDGGLAMTAQSPELGLDEVRERIRAAGLPIPEARLEVIHSLLRDALRPIRAFDTREASTLEPAPTFDAAAERDRHGRR